MSLDALVSDEEDGTGERHMDQLPDDGDPIEEQILPYCRANGIVTLDQTGTYFTIVGVQVGSRGGTGLVRLWFQTNGKDVDNSNCEQMVPNPEFTTVMISQGVGEYKKGDKVNTMISGSATGIGLVYKKPAGEPAVPSVIFSAWKID